MNSKKIDTNKHFHSFSEIAKEYGCKPVSRKTKDEEKLKSQKDKFCSKHKCRACGSDMTFIEGTNIMVCTNENCKGVPVKHINKDDDNVTTTYLTSYDVLNDYGANVANNIFS